jgi:hypothetical protein
MFYWVLSPVDWEPALIAFTQEINPERASRVRENKRRHRVRHKEYVLELEQRLAQMREQGVQATKEVQLAARQVAEENSKLRALLKKSGHTDESITAWLSETGQVDGSQGRRLALQAKPRKPPHDAVSACPPDIGGFGGANVCENKAEAPIKTSTSSRCSRLSENPSRAISTTNTEDCSTAENSSLSEIANPATAPCKLLTLLAENPATDITQIPLPSRLANQSGHAGEPKSSSSDGVDCATAYRMLIQHANSEEKLDRIAVALENGCTPSAGGGCSVKNSVVWKVLDEECA